MALRAEEADGLVAFHRRTEEEPQHTAHLIVEFLGGVAAFEDGLLVGIGEVVVVVGIGLAHRQTVGPCAELEVETVLDGFIGIVTAAPVGDDDTVEAPVVLQNLVEHRGIMAVVLVLIEVVGAHDGPGSALLHSSLEGGQVYLVEGTVGDDDVHLMTVFLVVVEGVMLHTGSDTLRLQALYVWHYHTGDQPGIFAHVFEVTTVEWGAEDVDARAEHHALVPV